MTSWGALQCGGCRGPLQGWRGAGGACAPPRAAASAGCRGLPRAARPPRTLPGPPCRAAVTPQCRGAPSAGGGGFLRTGVRASSALVTLDSEILSAVRWGTFRTEADKRTPLPTARRDLISDALRVCSGCEPQHAGNQRWACWGSCRPGWASGVCAPKTRPAEPWRQLRRRPELRRGPRCARVPQRG